MDERWQMPNVSGLEDREVGLLIELRILNEANVIAPVLEMIAASLEALFLESERQAWQKAQKRRQEDLANKASKLRSLGKVSRQKTIPIQFKPDNMKLRKLIAEKTAAGQWLSRLDREFSSGIRRSTVEEIAKKARLAGMNRCRAYIGATH
jgi:hypothetical protein